MKLNFKNLKKINLSRFLKITGLKKQLIFGGALVIFIASNLLLSSFFWRLDFSNGQAYTLSLATKNILRQLQKPVTIKLFVSSDLPTRLIVVKNEVRDFLNEYNKAGRGKIIVKILDPKKDTNAQKEVEEAGLPQLRFSQYEANKYAISAAYFGIVVSFNDKKEIITQATDLESLEYNLTASVYKLTKKQLGKVAIVGLSESFDSTSDQLATLKKVLRQQFEINFIDIAADNVEKTVNKNYQTLLVFDDNQKEYTSAEVEKIKKYLEEKGKAIFFVDGVWVSPNLQTSDAKNNLFGLLRQYGIEINKNLVLSASAEMVNFGNQNFQFYLPYPFWLKTNNFNTQLSFFSNINQLTFPWVSSLTLKKQPDVKTEILVKSTKNSWVQKDSYTLDPQMIPQPTADSLKEEILAAQSKIKNSGQLIVISSSRFVQEPYLSRTSDNLEFILNILNDLVSDGALSGIRQRAVFFYPLPELSESQKDLFKYFNILFLPGALAIFAAIKLLRKNRQISN